MIPRQRQIILLLATLASAALPAVLIAQPQDASPGEDVERMVRDGMVELREDGFRKVREGITTVEEILHIAGEVHESAGTG